MKEWIIKTGFFEEAKKGVAQVGLHLTRAILDVLVKKGLLNTTDCCVYTIPFSKVTGNIAANRIVEIPTANSNAHAGTLGVAIGGMYKASSTHTPTAVEGAVLVRLV